MFRLSLPQKMITAKNIFYSYENLNVLKGINLEIEKGEFVSIVGASVAGKTTLLNILGTLDKIDDGSLYINQKNISTFNEKEISKFRNQEIGFVFQFHNLLNEFTALENICMPAYLNGTNKQIAEKKGLELLDLLDLSNRSKHKPNELSGGEQQRVAVARALINSPSILLADEPSGNLDSQNADELHQLFFKLNKELKQTFIFVTHNQNLADMADRKLVMKDGVIVD